jgi:hypothetical protein
MQDFPVNLGSKTEFFGKKGNLHSESDQASKLDFNRGQSMIIDPRKLNKKANDNFSQSVIVQHT